MPRTTYASGRTSWGRCATCGKEVPYRSLVKQTYQFRNLQGELVRSNSYVCREDLDTDIQLKRVRADAIALEHPRPTERETILALDPWDNTTAGPTETKMPLPTIPADPNQKTIV